MRLRIECALSLAKSRSRGWAQIKCSRLVNISKIVHQSMNIAVAPSLFSGKTLLENWWPHVLRVCFCNSYCIHSKTKNGTPKEVFCSSYRRGNWRTPCRKRLQKHLKRHKYCCINFTCLLWNRGRIWLWTSYKTRTQWNFNLVLR